MKFDELTYLDPSARRRPIRVPTLKKLEQKLYNSLRRTPGTYIKKSWLASSRKNKEGITTHYILHGTKKEDPYSGDFQIRLWTEKIKLED